MFLDLHAGVASRETLPKPYLNLTTVVIKNLAQTLPVKAVEKVGGPSGLER